MPYYPEGKETDDACKKLRLYSVCAECSGRLVVRWDLVKHREYLICNENEEHEGIRKTWPDTLKEIRRNIGMDSTALMKLERQEMVDRIEQAKWPAALKPEEKALIAVVALSYGLDPILNELSIYQGRPYPTVNAWYRKSQETGQFDGMDSRPATKQEREERNAKDGDLLYRCEVWRKGASHPFVGWGKVRKGETTPGSTRQGDTTSTYKPIQNDPDRMAEKRAEMMAMRKAFSIPMPTMSFEEVIETESGTVVKATGEILDGEVVKVPEQQEEQAAAAGPEEEEDLFPKPEQPPVGGLDMDWLKEAMAKIKWTDKTATSFIKSKTEFKGIDVEGRLTEVLSRMSKEQQGKFVKMVQELESLA